MTYSSSVLIKKFLESHKQHWTLQHKILFSTNEKNESSNRNILKSCQFMRRGYTVLDGANLHKRFMKKTSCAVRSPLELSFIALVSSFLPISARWHDMVLSGIDQTMAITRVEAKGWRHTKWYRVIQQTFIDWRPIYFTRFILVGCLRCF